MQISMVRNFHSGGTRFSLWCGAFSFYGAYLFCTVNYEPMTQKSKKFNREHSQISKYR